MADPSRSPETKEDTGVGPNQGAASRTPRWVLVLGIIIAIALVVLIVLLHLTGTLGPGVH
ncbi:MAG TPA: hypothetical protein VF986_03180 [Actinomycetota bacterium]